MRESSELDPVVVAELLSELRIRLVRQGVSGRLRVVGGAAVAGHFPDDAEVRVTQDIDALYWPKAEVEVVAREIAAERGLPSGWLNDNARPWSPRGDDRRPTNSFQISFADLDELVAMKLAGSREQDLKDLEILSRQMGIQHPEQLVRIAYEQYGEDSVALNESREDYLEIARQVLARAKKHRRR